MRFEEEIRDKVIREKKKRKVEDLLLTVDLSCILSGVEHAY